MSGSNVGSGGGELGGYDRGGRGGGRCIEIEYVVVLVVIVVVDGW